MENIVMLGPNVLAPEDLSLLGAIYDLVVDSLPGRMRTPRNRRQVALNLLCLSLRGERDPLELELGAAAGLTC
ncbi:hypothetical protein [Bradyrhizobium sp. CCGE-LA001]|uniref:hypothetical protein n=1 Tax=Bradyrhizobium sp. CCGE-LA001 TaxID=1223566 RepID=UPI0002AA8097|nr:hypothetical protein [Bradyrhizobium sp. CCGE-LA001]AMA60285.1 hypothetical protein BCCGELA001_31465 [Bradyrhizobium sp. CCGE-LA001]